MLKGFEGPRLDELPLQPRRLVDPLHVIYFTEQLPGDILSDIRLKTLSRSIKEDKYTYPLSSVHLTRLSQSRCDFTPTFEAENAADLRGGYSAEGLRLLHKPKLTTRDQRRLETLLENLEKTRLKGRAGGHYWLKLFLRGDAIDVKPSVNFGVGSGLAGIVLFLAWAINEHRSKDLIEGIFRYAQSVDKAMGRRGLPAALIDRNERPLMALADFVNDDGDLCMGYAFTVAGLQARKRDWAAYGKKLFIRGLRRRRLRASKLIPYIFDGWGGYALLGYRFWELTGEAEALIAAQKWLGRANRLFETEYRERETKHVRSIVSRLRKIHGRNVVIPHANIGNSSLGLYLINETVSGRLKANWDSCYGLTRPRGVRA